MALILHFLFKMNDTKKLAAEYIRENKNQIIAEWERRVREESF